MSVNASLQNDSYDDKKHAKYDLAGKKIRNGYADGSHSEIEVSQSACRSYPIVAKQCGYGVAHF